MEFQSFCRSTAAVLIATVSLAITMRGASAASNWQASVSPGVELAVRDASTHFVADFALTSPSGVTRHARVPSDPTGSAAVRFGDAAVAGPFGLPDEHFSPDVSGRWTWRCVVARVPVAHGSFTVARNADGTASIRTTPADFAP